MRGGWPVAIVLAAIAVVAVLILRGRLSSAEADARRFQQRAEHVESVVVPELKQQAALNASWAQQAEHRADSIARNVEVRVDTLEVRVRDVRLIPVPDTCRTVVAKRDTIIDRYAVAVTGLQAAYRHQLEARFRTLRALSLTSSALDSVSAVLESRPKPRSRWIPDVRPGAFAGLCAKGACAGVGVTLSWRVW